MANNNKKYVSLTRLSTFLDNIKARYALIGHKHTTKDITDYVVDSELKSNSNNPVANSVLNEEFDAISDALGALELAIDGKSDSTHNHDSVYYTKTYLDSTLSNKADKNHNHDSDYADIDHNHDGVYSLIEHNHDSKYDTKGSASAVQQSLNTVSDTLDAHIEDTDIHVTATNKINWNDAHAHSTYAHARVDATKVEDSTTNGNIKIDGTETNVYSHPNSGVSAGIYKSVTVDAQGHVIGGSNPTTLAGFGITDAEEKGTVLSHDISTTSHADIRDLITGLSNRLNAIADSDDTTLDQLSEIVTYIKDNKSLIDSVTTSKVNVSDIINNLTTNVANKPLSAAQGVEIKRLIDALQSALDSHSHEIADVYGLQSALDGKANSSHGTHVSYSNTAPAMDGVASVGTASTVARSDHKHPTDTSRASKVEFDAHDSDTTKHITSTERTSWNETKATAELAQEKANSAYALAESKVDSLSDLGITVTETELNYMDGVTSNVQLQLDEMKNNIDSIPQSDWNQNDSTKLDYVKNRTHYMSIEPTTLVDETANCTMGSHTFSAYFNIEIGENYTVIFDGTTYECTGFSDGGLPTIGAPYNKYTDYPFNIYTYKNKLYVITQEYGFYDVQIIGNAQVFHTIDERYLPDTLAKVDDLERIENSISNKVNISSINGVELELSATVEDHGWSEMAYGNGKYVVVGGQSFMYSTDGKNWTMGTLPNSAQGIAFGNGVFCTYGYSGTTICYSADGINWNTADTNYNSNKFGIVFLNGRFYISAGTAILHSANCVSWSTISLGKNIALSDGAYGNGTYVMCGDGYAVVSTNGTNWTTVTMPTNDYYDSVCFAKGRFVAFAHYTVNFGATNKIAYSIDGVNWTTGTLPISAKWVGAKYANGMFVVAGFTGMVYSADGDNWEVGSLLDGWSTVGCIGFGKELLFINEGQIVFGKINPYGLSFKKDQQWNLIYDSGEISAIANSISNIDVSGYKNIQVLVRLYNDGDSVGSRAGSAIFTCTNGKTYQFPVWSSMFSKSINTVYTMATFNLANGWLVCPYASRLIGDATTFDDEGGTAGNLALTGSGMMKCTSQLSTLTISSLDQNSNYYFGMGSRVMVWGWNA